MNLDGMPSTEDIRLAARQSQWIGPDKISHDVFDLCPDAILVSDTRGVIVKANRQARILFFFEEAELLGKHIQFFIPRASGDCGPDKNGSPATGDDFRSNSFNKDLRGIRRDLSEFPVEMISHCLETGGNTLLLSFVRDISTERAALSTLLQSQEELRSMTVGLSDYAIFLLDVHGQIASWSEAAQSMIGYVAEEIVGRNFSLFYSQEEAAAGKPQEELRIAEATGRFEEEGWRIRKNGSHFWANVATTAVRDNEGALTGFAKVIRDITERKLVESSLLVQLSRVILTHVDFPRMLSAISDGIHLLVQHDCATLEIPGLSGGQVQVHFLNPSADRAARRTEIAIPFRFSPVELVCRSRMPIVFEDLVEGHQPYAPETVRHLVESDVHAACWVPLTSHEHCIGALMLARREGNAFSAHEVELLRCIVNQLATSIEVAVATQQTAELTEKLTYERKYFDEETGLEQRYEDIVGDSEALKKVLEDIEAVAPTPATVLIQGETGTGKELLARAVHRLSPRRGKPFIHFNCAAIPAGLIESELFGHERGAFTGAIARKIGRLELANEGTLFLDEIGDLPLDLQPKLLRALQERKIERLGGTRTISVDIRLVAATNRDLQRLVELKEFRSDLYYRLKVFPVYSPALRDRREDIPILVRHFVDIHARRMGKIISSISDSSMQALARWNWPGNIRELENFIERAVILTRGATLHVLLTELQEEDPEQEQFPESAQYTLKTAERNHILKVLRETEGRISGDEGAAKKLGLKRTTLYSKLRKLGVERGDY